MTKKHFEMLAAALSATRPDLRVDGGASGYRMLERQAAFNQWERMVSAIADVAARDNARFDRARFLTAAGMEN